MEENSGKSWTDMQKVWNPLCNEGKYVPGFQNLFNKWKIELS